MEKSRLMFELRRIKTVPILTNVIPVSQVDHVHDIMIVTSGLANLNKSVVSKYNFLKDRTGINALRFQKILIWVFVLSKHPIIPRFYPSMFSLLGVPPKSLGRSVWRTKKFRIQMTIFVSLGHLLQCQQTSGNVTSKLFKFLKIEGMLVQNFSWVVQKQLR